jgi:hypothetical protein
VERNAQGGVTGRWTVDVPKAAKATVEAWAKKTGLTKQKADWILPIDENDLSKTAFIVTLEDTVLSIMETRGPAIGGLACKQAPPPPEPAGSAKRSRSAEEDAMLLEMMGE